MMPRPSTPHSAATLRTLTHVVDRATRAPSVNNTQPWRFIAVPNGLLLRADRRRQLAVLDPDGRELMISCGCVLFNARVAAAAAGLHPTVYRFPDATDADLLAWIEIDPRAGSAPDDELAALAPVIQRRHNNRRPYSSTPMPTELADTLRAAAHAEGAVLTEIRKPADRATLAMLSQRADAEQLADPAYRAELRAWMHDDPRRTDGVPAITVPHVAAGAHEDVPIRDLDTHGHGVLPVRTGSDRQQCLLLLSSDRDDPQGWLRAGEALERVLLEIARYPVPPGSHPAAQWVSGVLSQAIEVPEVRRELRRELALESAPMTLIRAGVAVPTAGTPRRPLADVLVERATSYRLRDLGPAEPLPNDCRNTVR